MEVTDLPALNAGLNVVAAVLLALGYFFIRRGDRERHKLSMLAACVTSTAFLTSYLIYHWHVGSVPFTGQGWIRPVYFVILISHIVLAMGILPLALVTVTTAWRGKFDRHRRVAKWTWPLWMYVSVSGIVIYLALYHG